MRWYTSLRRWRRLCVAARLKTGCALHITAAIYVNDNEDGLIEDIGVWLEKLAPRWPGYKHHQTGEDNADAHLKALLLHHETTLPVTDGRLDLGTWQRVFYAEFD